MGSLNSADIAKRADELSKQTPPRTLRKDGDVEAVFKSASASSNGVKVVESAYVFPSSRTRRWSRKIAPRITRTASSKFGPPVRRRKLEKLLLLAYLACLKAISPFT